VESVVARRGSYGSQDPTRKGGSDEGEEKPEKELVGSWIRRVVFFFEWCPCHLLGTANNLWQVRQWRES
jgi:hypothetical protein